MKFVFLTHPKEYRRQKTGTGNLAKASLVGSEVIVGVDFQKNARLTALLSDKKYIPLLLYPSEDADSLGSSGLLQSLAGKIPLIIIIDGTWSCAKKIVRLNTALFSTIKHLRFTGVYNSIFTIKHEPREDYISTIESCYYLIKEAQAVGVVNTKVDPSPLMRVFKAMVRGQLIAENERVLGLRPNTFAQNIKYTKLKEIPSYLQDNKS